MKKFLLLIALSVLCFVGAFSPLPHALSTVFLTAPDGFSIACDATYSRFTPHHCVQSSGPTNYVTLTMDNVCRTFGSFPTTVTGLDLAWNTSIVSANAIANRTVTLSLFKDSGCTISSGASLAVLVREFAAVAGGTTLLQLIQQIGFFPVTAGGTNIWFKGLLTTCVNCAMNVAIIGYYD